MLRRRTHERSKKGCLTCKERHVRCDERRPYCRNCVRLGRECRFSAGSSSTWIEERPEKVITPITQNEWVARNAPHQHTVYYCAPHHQHISPRAISIVQQSQAISLARPMPRSCLATISKHYFPKYNQIAAHYDCVKYALVSFSAYAHFQATKSPISEEVCISHANIALRELQKEIDHFGPSNADAVIASSVALTGATQDWEQWAVFVDGYSKALTQMKDSKFPTVFPDLLGERFQLRKFSSMSNSSSQAASFTASGLLYPDDRGRMKKRVRSITTSITDAKGVIDTVKWHGAGFAALEKLGRTIETALSLEDEIETYHQLAWLRSWMFWIDLRQTDDSKEEHMLDFHFYALLLAVVPIFPARYRESLAEACKRRIRVAKQAISEDTALVDRERRS